MKFFTKPRLICTLLLAAIAGALFFSYTVNPKLQRTLLYFRQSGGSTGVEERYLPQSSGKELAVLIVDELLLGPFDHNLLRFCDPELRPRTCFVRKSALYLDLPAQILTPQVKTPDFHTVYMLLRKNILTNCKDIDTVYIYIDGVPAYMQNAAL